MNVGSSSVFDEIAEYVVYGKNWSDISGSVQRSGSVDQELGRKT